jgi:hypothetical protein
MDNSQKAVFEVVCMMYGTAANLAANSMIQDASSVAAKARALLNKALDGLIDPITLTESQTDN